MQNLLKIQQRNQHEHLQYTTAGEKQLDLSVLGAGTVSDVLSLFRLYWPFR